MQKSTLLQLSALCAGAAGFVLRKWQLMTAYDYDSELFLRGMPATYALIALLAVLAVVCLLAVWKPAPLFYTYPPVCTSPLYMTLMATGGFLYLGAGVLGLLEGIDLLQRWKVGLSAAPFSYHAAVLLCGGLCLASGVAVLLMGKTVYRNGDPGKAACLSCLPPFALLVWLFATHQAHATDPVFLRYGLLLTGIALVMLVHYDVAAFYQKQAHSRRILFCTVMGTALLMTSLADGLAWYQMALAAACVVTAQAQCFALLYHGQPAPGHDAPASDSPDFPEL